MRNADTQGYFYLNGEEKERVFSGCRPQDDDVVSVPIQTTLKLETGDKVEVRYHGILYEADYQTRAFFEGRFISKIEE